MIGQDETIFRYIKSGKLKEKDDGHFLKVIRSNSREWFHKE